MQILQKPQAALFSKTVRRIQPDESSRERWVIATCLVSHKMQQSVCVYKDRLESNYLLTFTSRVRDWEDSRRGTCAISLRSTVVSLRLHTRSLSHRTWKQFNPIIRQPSISPRSQRVAGRNWIVIRINSILEVCSVASDGVRHRAGACRCALRLLMTGISCFCSRAPDFNMQCIMCFYLPQGSKSPRICLRVSLIFCELQPLYSTQEALVVWGYCYSWARCFSLSLHIFRNLNNYPPVAQTLLT